MDVKTFTVPKISNVSGRGFLCPEKLLAPLQDWLCVWALCPLLLVKKITIVFQRVNVIHFVLLLVKSSIYISNNLRNLKKKIK